MKTLEEIQKEIEALNARAQTLVEEAKDDSTKTAEVKAIVDDEIKPQLDILTKEHEKKVKEQEFTNLADTVTSLKGTIEDLRKPADGFMITSPKDSEGKASDDDSPYADKDHSPFVDIFLSNKGSQAARERLSHGNDRFQNEGFQTTEEGKVLTGMTEGTPTQGGYLVQPELERQLLLAREADNVIRPLVSSITVNTNAIQLDQLGIKTAAAWTAELATKFEETAMTIKSITASVFTAAGLATISNQLLADSNPAVDQLVTTDLAKRLVALEEISFLSGSGEGQPLGILNTPEVGTTLLTNSEDPATEGGLLDAILEAIAAVQLEWGQPSAIVMHPRTWTRIIKSRDTAGHYTIAPRNNFGAGYDPATPRTFVTGPEQTLFGVNVILSNRIPTNLGEGTDESRVIVGDFQEALILDRQGITLDSSEHVYFTANATIFRAECRVGFTAGRNPKAFNIIGGSGLSKG